MDALTKWSVISLVAVHRRKIMTFSDNLQDQKVICDCSPHLAISPAIYPPPGNLSTFQTSDKLQEKSVIIRNIGCRANSVSLVQGITPPSIRTL